MRIAAEVERGLAIVGGDDVPPDPAAGDQQVDVAGRTLVGLIVEGADRRPDRVAHDQGAVLHRSGGLPERREGAADGRGAGRQEAVGPSDHRILLVDHRRAPRGKGGKHGWQGGIPAEAHHHGGVQAPEGGPGLHHAAADLQGRPGHADGIAPAEGGGREAHALLGRELVGELGAALVSGQHDAPAARRKGLGQGLGGEQVAAGAPGRHHGQLAAHAKAPAGATVGAWA